MALAVVVIEAASLPLGKLHRRADLSAVICATVRTWRARHCVELAQLRRCHALHAANGAHVVIARLLLDAA